MRMFSSFISLWKTPFLWHSKTLSKTCTKIFLEYVDYDQVTWILLSVPGERFSQGASVWDEVKQVLGTKAFHYDVESLLSLNAVQDLDDSRDLHHLPHQHRLQGHVVLCNSSFLLGHRLDGHLHPVHSPQPGKDHSKASSAKQAANLVISTEAVVVVCMFDGSGACHAAITPSQQTSSSTVCCSVSAGWNSTDSNRPSQFVVKWRRYQAGLYVRQFE